MAVIADLMRTPENILNIAPDYFLEVGSGHAKQMFVIYPVKGELRLGVGSIMSYYEFLSPSRMTDEEFQEKLNDWDNPFPAHESMYNFSADN